MKVLDPGHVYELSSLDGGEPIILTFVKREGKKYPGNVGSHPGTTLQECWRAEIERLKYVNGQLPCAESEACIGLLQTCIFLLENRAARRHNEQLFLSDIQTVDSQPVCGVCGHILCEGHDEG